MNYYEDEQDDRRGRVWGIIGVVAYLVLCVGVMFVTYKITLPQPEVSVLIDFGVGETGDGDEDTALSEPAAVPVRPSNPNVSAERILVTEDPDAPAVAVETNPRTQPVTTTETTPARQVNERALFPGRTEGSTSASQGTTGGEGNRGLQDGAPGGSDSAGGLGSSGFSLAGRYMVGNLPRPAYSADAEGRVVIRITVNSEGRVTNAVYEQAGSTTNHGELVGAARAAALRARFTPSEEEIQTGTITYIFRLN